MSDINKKLSEIQKKLVAPKNQKNTFGNYNYRSAEDILEGVKKLLGDATLIVSDEMEIIGDRYYIKATAKLSLGKESVETTAFAREALSKKGMDEAQVTGSASSYARKYALNGLFAIDDTKDADTMDNTKSAPVKKAPVKKAVMITKVQEKEIDFLVSSRGRTTEEVCKLGKIKSIKELTKARADKLVKHLKGLPEATLQ